MQAKYICFVVITVSTYLFKDLFRVSAHVLSLQRLKEEE
jgi:hypothetical protein